ncbi:MAG: DUF58 domain-containing protein [Thermoflexales bacterium]|nr:DUF58 domain-containing protein [Thermoflexales bacterium]
MSRQRVLWLLTALSLLAGFASGREMFFAAAGAILALIGITAIWAWSGVNWLRLSRRAATRVTQVGQVFEEELRLINLAALPKLWVEVRDASTLPDHHASRLIALIGGKQWRGWRVHTRCTRRGRFTLGPVTVRSSDPLGIWQMQRQLGQPYSLLVHPLTVELRDFPLRHSPTAGGEVLRRRTPYITTNAAGVREYAPGDSLNRIHWRTTAHRQKLMVKEFELDPLLDVWIVIDVAAASRVAIEAPLAGVGSGFLPPDSFEYAVAAAASIASYLLRQQGRKVGLIAHGAHRLVIQPDLSDRQHAHILDTLAVLEADGSLPFDAVLSHEASWLSSGVALVAITASPDVAWALALRNLARGGMQTVAVWIDPRSFGRACAEGNVIRQVLSHPSLSLRVLPLGCSLNTALQTAPAPTALSS